MSLHQAWACGAWIKLYHNVHIHVSASGLTGGCDLGSFHCDLFLFGGGVQHWLNLCVGEAWHWRVVWSGGVNVDVLIIHCALVVKIPDSESGYGLGTTLRHSPILDIA